METRRSTPLKTPFSGKGERLAQPLGYLLGPLSSVVLALGKVPIFLLHSLDWGPSGLTSSPPGVARSHLQLDIPSPS